MSQVTHRNWVVSRLWVSHVTCLKTHESHDCFSERWMLMDLQFARQCTCDSKSCRIYEWVKSRTWMSRVTHTNESRHMYEDSWLLWLFLEEMHGVGFSIRKAVYVYKWFMSHIWMSHVTCLKTGLPSFFLYRYISESCHLMNESRHMSENGTSKLQKESRDSHDCFSKK